MKKESSQNKAYHAIITEKLRIFPCHDDRNQKDDDKNK